MLVLFDLCVQRADVCSAGGMHSLGVGLLQQGAPELVAFRGAEVDQLVVLSRQQVVYPHLLPLTVLPELQTDRQKQEV